MITYSSKKERNLLYLGVTLLLIGLIVLSCLLLLDSLFTFGTMLLACSLLIVPFAGLIILFYLILSAFQMAENKP